MSVRAFTTHYDKYGVKHDIELIKTGYGGSATELRGSDGFLVFNHENLSESDVFSTPIQKGRLDYGVWIDSAGQEQVIDEIRISQEGEFQIKWYQNSVLFWTGTVALDLSNFEEASFPYRAQIVAKDLSFIEGILFPTYEDPTPANSFASRRTLISLVAECLPYGLNIVTATSWVESHINSAQDFMRQVYLDASTLAGLTLYEALERIMVSNGLFLKQTDGVWLIEQLSAHQTPSSVTRWTYNSSGVYQSEAVVNPLISANSQLKVVTGSLSSFAPAYKQVTVQYDSVLDEALEIPETVDPRSTAQSYSMQYISQYDILNPDPSKIDRVRLSGTVKEEIFFATGSSATKITKTVKLQVYAGDQYLFVGENSWTSNGWISAPYDYPVTLKFDSYDTTTRLATFIGEFNIESTPIPKPTSTTNYGRLVVAFLSSSVFQIYENVKFELVQGDIVNSVVLTQADQFSTAFEQNVKMGDGPRPYAKSALRFATGALSLDKTTDQWQRRGSTSYRSHSVNLAKEIMDFQRSYGRTLQVRSRGAFTPSQTLSYDSEQFYYIGGQFDGYEGDWTMTFVRNQFSQDVDILSVAGVLRPASVGLGQLISSVVNQNRNSIEASGQFVLRLLLGATGTVSQIFVFDEDEFVQVRAGQVLRLVHPVTLQSDEVTVASDRISGATVNVVTKALSADYPEGSWVYISAQSVQAGILVGENAVRIFAEGQSMGALSADVDGFVTVIPVNLYTRVLRGMDLQVVNKVTGQYYPVTVDVDDAGPGQVNLQIEEQEIEARAGDTLVGDNAFQQSQITVTQGLIVLKVNSNGKVAQIKLGADDLGSEITISAEQVNINGIIFTEGTVVPAVPGNIRASNYSAGVDGWKIDGDGSAEFNNVVVRGSLLGGSGAQRYELTPAGGIVLGVAGSYISGLTASLLRLETSASIDPNAPIANVSGSDLHFVYGNLRLDWTPTDGNNVLFRMLLSGVPKVTLNGNSGNAYLAGGLETDATADATSEIGAPNQMAGGLGVVKKIWTGQGIYFAIDAGVDPATPTGRFAIDGVSYQYGNVRMQFVPSDANNASLVLSLSNAPKVTLNSATGAGTFAGKVTVSDTTQATSKDTGSIITEGGVGVEKNLVVGGLLVAPRVGFASISDADSPYTVDADTEVIFVDTTVASVDLYLGSQVNGRRVTICDQTGNFSVNACGLYSSGSDTIRGVGGFYDSLIDSYMSITLVYYNGSWTITSRTT